MNQAEIYPQPQNIYERCKKWVIGLFQREERHTVTPQTDILTPGPKDRVFATEQEGLKSATALADTETRGSHDSHPRHQPDARISHTQSPYRLAVPAKPSISSFATQFEGAHNFTISGNPTFTNIGVNNGVNNVNTVNNHGGVHVDNRGQQSYNIKVGTQYGNTNIGDNQINDGGTYNFKGNH